jgi:hypothetical protein
VARSGSDLVLTWTGTGFDLQSADAVSGPWTTMTGAVSPTTVPITGTQRYFQLRSQ